MDLEELVKVAKRMPLKHDRSQFGILKENGEDFVEYSYEIWRTSGMGDGEFLVFTHQSISFGQHPENSIKIDIFPIPNDEYLVVPPLDPDVKRVYLVQIDQSNLSKGGKSTQECAAYLITGDFIGNNFRFSNAWELAYEKFEPFAELLKEPKPKKLGKVSIQNSKLLMELLRASNLFPQNERENQIASWMESARFNPSYISGTCVSDYFYRMMAHAEAAKK